MIPGGTQGFFLGGKIYPEPRAKPYPLLNFGIIDSPSSRNETRIVITEEETFIFYELTSSKQSVYPELRSVFD